MKPDELTNVQLLTEFELICFRITINPNHKGAAKEFKQLEKEIAKRLNITEEELEQVILNT